MKQSNDRQIKNHLVDRGSLRPDFEGGPGLLRLGHLFYSINPKYSQRIISQKIQRCEPLNWFTVELSTNRCQAFKIILPEMIVERRSFRSEILFKTCISFAILKSIELDCSIESLDNFCSASSFIISLSILLLNFAITYGLLLNWLQKY